MKMHTRIVGGAEHVLKIQGMEIKINKDTGNEETL